MTAKSLPRMQHQGKASLTLVYEHLAAVRAAPVVGPRRCGVGFRLRGDWRERVSPVSSTTEAPNTEEPGRSSSGEGPGPLPGATAPGSSVLGFPAHRWTGTLRRNEDRSRSAQYCVAVAPASDHKANLLPTGVSITVDMDQFCL